MLIYNHPEIKIWNPYAGVAYPPPYPSEKERELSVVHDVIYKPEATIVFVFIYPRGFFRSGIRFKDVRFAKALYHNKFKLNEIPTGAIGLVDIPYGRLHLVEHCGLTSDDSLFGMRGGHSSMADRSGTSEDE